MLNRMAFIRECANKEAEDAYASGGGHESYEAIQHQADEQIDREWREWQQIQQQQEEA